MEINLGQERIVQLRATYSAAEVQELAARKRVDAFGQVAKLFQRPKAEDIAILGAQLRFEPFWFAAASARYTYDRRHAYRVPVAPEVRAVTVYGSQHPVTQERNATFELPAVEHCVEELHLELILDAVSGQEGPFAAYLGYPQIELPEIAALEKEGAVAVLPEVRGSFVVRKLVSLLMRTFQADQIHEERIDVAEVTLFFRPVYDVELLWQGKDKKQVLEFDALTGESRAAPGETKKRIARVLDNDALFDIGADTVGAVLPGANIAIKLGRLAARKAIQ